MGNSVKISFVVQLVIKLFNQLNKLLYRNLKT